jgi:DNA sulfur modification protein DndE
MSGSRRVNLSEDSTEYLNRLHFRLQSKCEKSAIYKMAFAKGLISSGENFFSEYKSDSKGSEIRIDSIENIIFDALIRQKFKTDKLENKGRYYKLLIDYGSMLLSQEDEGDENKLILQLYKNSKLPKMKTNFESNYKSIQKGPITRINLQLGEGEKESPITITWNDKGHTGQHIGITGKTGAGKTQLALELISQIYEQNKGLNVIYFDYAKGDVAANKNFSNLIGAEVIDIAEEGVPYNPFFIDDVSDQKIEELKDIFSSIQKRIGPKQSLELFDIFQEAYSLYDEPDLSAIYQLMIDTYEEQGKSKDVLVELFHKLEIPKIFPESSKEGLYRTLADKSIIFDLHNIDSHMKVKELITFLILNKIYTESIRLPDSAIDEKTGLREMRTLVVIDEAHNYLDANNRILERMLRELRSKGVAIMLLTQGFDDLVQKQFDYSSMVNWILLMKSDNSKQGVEKALAVPKEVANKLSIEISTADTGLIYTRKLRENDKFITKINGKAFWQRYI